MVAKRVSPRPNGTQEDDAWLLFDKPKSEEVLDLEAIDFRASPTEAFQGLDDWKASGFDPPSNRALLTGRDFALKEPTQVVEMAPVVGGAFDSQGLAVFFDRSQLEVIKVVIEQEVGRISSHGLGMMGMVSSLRRRRDRAARVRPRADLGAW